MICGIHKIRKGYGKGRSSRVPSIAHSRHGLRSTRRPTNVPKVYFLALSLVMKVPNHIVAPNKGAGNALLIRGGYWHQFRYLAALLFFCFTFLFTSSLNTLHCLKQVLPFQKCVFCKTHEGNDTTIIIKTILHSCFLRIASHGITFQCE